MASAGGDGLRRLAQRAERMQERWPRDAATEVERVVTSALHAATGDGALSHGRNLGRATVEVEARPGAASVTAGGSMGVWAIINRGTRAHDVVAAPGRPLSTPYGPRQRVHVAGAPGKQVWPRAVTAAMPRVRASADEAFREVVG